MTTAVPCIDCTSITNYLYVGFGPDSLAIGRIFSDIDSGNTTQTLGGRRELLNDLNEISAKYSNSGWDGYDARPISGSAYLEAEKLIRALPISPTFPMPEIIPEPTGGITFEWYREKRQVFILSVSGKNEIVYSGLFGVNKIHGIEYFGDSLPSVIFSTLKRLYS
ncbi:MAG: hypothetical protein WCO26_01515 [Deltaproteobacteria bacterium]